MFPFRRRNKNKADQRRLESKRHLYRAPVNPEQIQATVIHEGGESLDAGVVDLSLEGVGIEVPFHLDPEFAVEEVISLRIYHPHEDWSVETAARVQKQHTDGGASVYYGLKFLNTGSLYAQMEDTLGRYFNRRRHERVRPELDQDVTVRLGQAGQRVRGPVHDLSQSGMCIALDLVSGAAIEVGKAVEVAFELPDCKHTFEGHGKTVAKRRLGLKEFLSIEFELDAGGSLAERHADLVGYVKKRGAQMAAFSAALMSESD